VRLKKDWWAVLSRAWSVRLIVLASVLTGIEAFLPVAWDFGWLEGRLFPFLTLFVTMAALFARLIVQTGLTHED